MGKIFFSLWLFLSLGVTFYIQGVSVSAFAVYSTMVLTIAILVGIFLKVALPIIMNDCAEPKPKSE